jgi:hypothetical protein
MTYTDQNRPYMGQAVPQAPGFTKEAFAKASARVLKERG